MARYEFTDKQEFIKKLEELVASGVPKGKVNTLTPYHVHEAEHILDDSPSAVRFFQGAGATAGFITGFAFTIGTALAWPMITGGKGLVAIPAYMVIAYELTILFGCLTGFVGFLHLSRVPVFQNLFAKEPVFERNFIIEVDA